MPPDGQQTRSFEFGEHLDRATLGGAVDPHPGPIGAPHLRPCLGIGQVGEGLPGPEVPADVLNDALDPWLVLG